MNIALTTDFTAMGAKVRPEHAPARTMRLWPSLSAAWTRHLEQRIEDDLNWLGHTGVLEDFRSASHG
jgi:hypothetical protein